MVPNYLNLRAVVDGLHRIRMRNMHFSQALNLASLDQRTAEDLVHLSSHNIDDQLAKHQSPVPSEPLDLEHPVVDDGDVDNPDGR